MRLKGLFLLLAFLLAYPVEVLAADFNWTLTRQGGEMLTETIVTDNQDLINREGDWQRTRSSLNPSRVRPRAGQPTTSIRTGYRFSQDQELPGDQDNQDRARCRGLWGRKHFLSADRIRLRPVRMEMPGLIMQAPQAEKSTWREGFAGTFSIAPQAQAEAYNLAMIITIEIVPSVIAVLVVGWA